MDILYGNKGHLLPNRKEPKAPIWGIISGEAGSSKERGNKGVSCVAATSKELVTGKNRPRTRRKGER